ncbi:MAG: DUF5663 domain-containing protein [Candidatus Saccharimonadales bacterium]
MNQYFITADTLDSLGIDLTGQDKDALLTHLNETLQERVGAEITDSLNDEQLKTLLDKQENASEEELGTWLEQTIPDFKQLVQDEIDILLGELAENSNGINETA